MDIMFPTKKNELIALTFDKKKQNKANDVAIKTIAGNTKTKIKPKT